MGNKKMKVIYIDGEIYVRPYQLEDLFPISRTTIWRYLKKFRATPKYKNCYSDLGWKTKLIKLKAFENFLLEQDRQYLKR